MKNSSIFLTLEKLGLTSKESRILFSNRTRDLNKVDVWKDKLSGVIYIDSHYIGDDFYKITEYQKSNYERECDVNRRFNKYGKFVIDKKMVDFGCGTGDFLKSVSNKCEFACGVELSSGFRNKLINEKINCVESLNDLEDGFLDIIVAFHVFEHLSNPLVILSEIMRKIKSGGQVLIEVPHANDFLLASSEEFKQFALWSQHLILHTRESLRRILEYAGFQNIHIEGVQRYSLSNHLNWLINKKPGGHKSHLAILDSDSLNENYESSLSRIDATDTLVAFAKVP